MIEITLVRQAILVSEFLDKMLAMGGVSIVAITRHGAKDGDELTDHGVKQTYFLGKMFLALNIEFTKFIYSGAHRTWQTSTILAGAMGLRPAPEASDDFHFQKPFNEVYGDDTAKFNAEWDEMKKKNGGSVTVEQALEDSEYARKGRARMKVAIIKTAYETLEGKIVAVSCHSPYTELATSRPETTPYGLGECDTIFYSVNKDGKIIDSILVNGPISGKPLR